ncbi:MAG: response regulator transcription factor [Bacteroidales bacterium]
MIIDLIDNKGDEFYASNDNLYYIIVTAIPFESFETDQLNKIKYLLDKDVFAQASLDLLGIKNEMDRLKKFGMCNFGGFDQDQDIDSDSQIHVEYYNCGQRGKCPVEGKLCKTIMALNGYMNPREIDILKLIVQDLADKQIADRLGISDNTVHKHRSNIQHKIGCSSKVGICRWAIQKGIV